MSNINKNVKIASLKKTIKITSNIIKISLENLIDDVNKKTSSIQKEIDDVIEKINKLPGNKYQYKEKFVIDDEKPNFTNEIDELDYKHESLIFKYAQLEIKLNTLKEEYYKNLFKKIKTEICDLKKKLEGTNYAPYKNLDILIIVDDETKYKFLIKERNYYKTIIDGTKGLTCAQCDCKICICRITPALKRVVWEKYIGFKFELYKCVCCCEKIITRNSFHCGHVISRNDGGSLQLNNLRPICQTCNLMMGTTNMNTFRKHRGYDLV